MKKILIIISFIAVSITGVKAQLFMHIGPSDSLSIVGLSIGQSGLNVGVKDSLKPDLYIDGVKYDSKILDMINSKKIESIEVIKGEAAIKEYNSPNGVLKITSRAESDKSEALGEIRIRATGNIDSLDQAIAIHRLSDEETEKIMIFEKSRLLGNTGNKTPVIVIDGKVRSQEELSKLSPFDIESITVLKDESAKILYDAPNGAIIIETKKQK